jgi:hypothetical protein
MYIALLSSIKTYIRMYRQAFFFVPESLSSAEKIPTTHTAQQFFQTYIGDFQLPCWKLLAYSCVSLTAVKE